MTSADARRPTPTMTTVSRSRFSNFAVGNGNEKTTQAIGTSFAGSSWQPGGIWGNSGIGFIRDSATANAAVPEDSFNGQPTGSALLTATSEAESSWGGRPGGWNIPEAAITRNFSGNTSPPGPRQDSGLRESSSASPFYPSQASLVPSGTIGPPRAGASTRPKAGHGFDASFNLNQYHEYGEERDSATSFGSLRPEDQELVLYRNDRRALQEGYYPSGGINYQVETESKHPNSMLDHAYNISTSNVRHVQRLPHGAMNMPFSSQANTHAFHQNHNNTAMDDEVLQERIANGLTLNDGSSGQTVLGYPASSENPFPFNPAIQPWVNVRSFTPQYAKDPYSEPLGGTHPKRAMTADLRDLPGSNAYRPLMNSPKTYSGPPQSGVDLWSRPTSRDPRLGELERRNAQLVAQHQASYLGPPAFFAHSYAQYPPSPYDTMFVPNYRHLVSFPGGFGASVNTFLSGPVALPMGPSKYLDPAKGIRSALLEEFRSNSRSNRRYELKDIYNYVVEFSGDQHGSRFIQTKLETANSDEKDQIFREIEPNAIQLMKDVFGNYVIQKFFEHGNQVQKKVLAGVMKGKVVDLSMQMYACRVVQKALEHVLVEQQAELVRELEPEILKVVKDQNGNHVVQKIIELVPRRHIDFIMDCFLGRVSDLASHTYGCRVVQRVLEHGTERDKTAIMAELHNSSHFLITDQYGNYVIQHVIQFGKPEDRARMISIVKSQLVTLSKHKFASNVVEKSIEHGSLDERRQIIDGLVKVGSDGNSLLHLLMKDQYGNYVIQKLLSQLEGDDRAALVEHMKPQFSHIKKVSGNGRQIAAIDRLMTAASSPGPGTKNGTPLSTAPASPALPVDLSSAAQTPNLTTESNSPSSSGPPSTGASAAEEAVDETRKTKLAIAEEPVLAPVVRPGEA